MSDNSRIVKETLSKSNVHDQWEGDFRTKENAEFYDEAFDKIVKIMKPTVYSQILDVGCGIGAHSLRLAKRSLRVTGCDFSQGIIDKAREDAKQFPWLMNLNYVQADILDLPFAALSFDYVLCWGVLMHIPDIALAIQQITRVLKPGGMLIISEGNRDSLQSKWFEGLKAIFKLGDARRVVTSMGTQYWTTTAAGELMTRQADIPGLQFAISTCGFKGIAHFAGQFTELYSRFPFAWMRRIIHSFNRFYFRHIGSPGPAFANIIIMEKL